MITFNIKTNLGLSNGQSGTIVKIYPVENSERRLNDGSIVLTKVPLIVVKLDNLPDGDLPNFGPLVRQGCIPIVPQTDTVYERYLPRYRVSNKSTFAFKREQLPITVGYSITDYKAQGGSWDNVILDLRKTNTFRAATLYVMCSRVRSIDGLLIIGMPAKTKAETLRCFNTPLHKELLTDTERLQSLSDQTIENFYNTISTLGF